MYLVLTTSIGVPNTADINPEQALKQKLKINETVYCIIIGDKFLRFCYVFLQTIYENNI